MGLHFLPGAKDAFGTWQSAQDVGLDGADKGSGGAVSGYEIEPAAGEWLVLGKGEDVIGDGV